MPDSCAFQHNLQLYASQLQTGSTATCDFLCAVLPEVTGTAAPLVYHIPPRNALISKAYAQVFFRLGSLPVQQHCANS